jgi:hypothetical protein
MPVPYPFIAALDRLPDRLDLVRGRRQPRDGAEDPRTYGSHNPGATNVLRSGSKVAAILTLLLDALKGFVPVVLVQVFGDRFGLGEGSVALVALAAFSATCGRSSFASRAARALPPRPACCSASIRGSAWRLCSPG